MNFKKIFSRNNNAINEINKKRWNSLFKSEGFYIIMFLCVCIVGTTAVWVAKSNVDRLEADDFKNEIVDIDDSEIIDIAEGEMEKQLPDVIIIDEKDQVTQLEPSSNQTEEQKQESKQSKTAKKSKSKTLVKKQEKPKVIITEVAQNDTGKTTEDAIVASSSEVMAMIWPVDGKLGTGFAIETLVYSETLEHFTTHHGIDIMAEENTPVKAVLPGEVIEVLTDSRLGITISIKHEDGLITRYSNLCTDAMVKIGDKVSQGQTISGVGTSSIFESAEGPHLHFEVLKDGQNVDPMDYLAEN